MKCHPSIDDDTYACNMYVYTAGIQLKHSVLVAETRKEWKKKNSEESKSIGTMIKNVLLRMAAMSIDMSQFNQYYVLHNNKLVVCFHMTHRDVQCNRLITNRKTVNITHTHYTHQFANKPRRVWTKPVFAQKNNSTFIITCQIIIRIFLTHQCRSCFFSNSSYTFN